ncbi:MAG TPA: heavy metal translocating P-type ATPase [Pseudomonadota bacterium]|nr:heavy metal translocating P-type ATPase [Pseudomonadota bacterium]
MIVALLLLSGGLLLGSRLLEQTIASEPKPSPPPSPDEESDAPEHSSRRRVSLLSRGRQELLTKMKHDVGGDAAEPRERDVEEQEIHSDLAVGGATVALVAGGYLLPVLNLAALPFMLYGAGRLVGYTYEAWKKNEPIGMTLLDSTVVIGTLLFGPWLAPASSLLSSAVGRYLIRLTKDQSTARVTTLFERQHHQVWLLRDGTQIQVPLEQIVEGDVVVIDAGMVVPVDGVVIEGVARVDQQALTGESQPRDKVPGAPVLAASMVLEGRLQVRVERAGADTLAARLVETINSSRELSDKVRSRGQQMIDTCSLPTLGLGLITMPFLGIVPGLAVMESSFGSSLRYSGPLSVLNFLQIAAERGILIKDGFALERLGNIDTVVFDKTGTLTRDRQILRAVYVAPGYEEDTVISLAAAAEQNQEHPIARTICEAARARKLPIPALQEATVHLGRGLSVITDGRHVTIGSRHLLAAEGITEQQFDAFSSLGGSLVFVAIDGALAGALEFAPEIRPEAQALIGALHARGLSLGIISGDAEAPTRELAAALGIDTFYAEVLPEGKSAIIEQMRSAGRNVCFIGDGINDALALRSADVSISLRGATTVATDAASIIMMRGSFADLDALFDLADEFDRNMALNTALTIIPGAASIFGVYFLGFGIIAANLLYNTSIVLGLVNGMLPAVKVRDFGSPDLTPDSRPAPSPPRQLSLT